MARKCVFTRSLRCFFCINMNVLGCLLMWGDLFLRITTASYREPTAKKIPFGLVGRFGVSGYKGRRKEGRGKRIWGRSSDSAGCPLLNEDENQVTSINFFLFWFNHWTTLFEQTHTSAFAFLYISVYFVPLYYINAYWTKLAQALKFMKTHLKRNIPKTNLQSRQK